VAFFAATLQGRCGLGSSQSGFGKYHYRDSSASHNKSLELVESQLVSLAILVSRYSNKAGRNSYSRPKDVLSSRLSEMRITRVILDYGRSYDPLDREYFWPIPNPVEYAEGFSLSLF